jgi:hypothetical protein
MFDPGRLFQPSLMFVDRGKEPTTSGAPKSLTQKQYNSLEKSARGNHSSLIRIFVNYGRKRLYTIGPCSKPTI